MLREEFDGGIFVLANVIGADEFCFFGHPTLHFGSFEEELLSL